MKVPEKPYTGVSM